MQRLAKSFSFLCNTLFATIIVGAAVPGTHRVVCPDCFGLTEIAPRVWTDSEVRAIELVALRTSSQRRVGAFFEDEQPNPTTILCSTRACAEIFGIGGNGLSIADLVVMVSPGGLSLGTLTHEMTHSRLHRNMGVRNIWTQPFPTWFDEGLATYVANHPRFSGSVSDEARKRVRKVQRFWQWRPAMRELGVGRAYGAAALEVGALDKRLGRSGLLELIMQADAGEDFATLEKQRLQ